MGDQLHQSPPTTASIVGPSPADAAWPYRPPTAADTAHWRPPPRRPRRAGSRPATVSLVLAGAAIASTAMVFFGAYAWFVLAMGAKGMAAWLKPRIFVALLCWVVPLCVGALASGVVSWWRGRHAGGWHRMDRIEVMLAGSVSVLLLVLVAALRGWAR